MEVPISEDTDDVDNMTERTPLVSQPQSKQSTKIVDASAKTNIVHGIDDGEAESGPSDDSVFVFCRPEGTRKNL